MKNDNPSTKIRGRLRRRERFQSERFEVALCDCKTFDSEAHSPQQASTTMLFNPRRNKNYTLREMFCEQ